MTETASNAVDMPPNANKIASDANEMTPNGIAMASNASDFAIYAVDMPLHAADRSLHATDFRIYAADMPLRTADFRIYAADTPRHATRGRGNYIKRAFLFLILLIFVEMNAPTQAENIIFPANSGVIDIRKAPCNLTGDGVTAVTAAMQGVLSTFAALAVCENNSKRGILFIIHHFPSGEPSGTPLGRSWYCVVRRIG